MTKFFHIPCFNDSHVGLRELFGPWLIRVPIDQNDHIGACFYQHLYHIEPARMKKRLFDLPSVSGH